MFLHQEELQGSPGRSMKHLPHHLWQFTNLQGLSFGGSIPSWVLWKGRKGFVSAGKARAQGQPGEGRCPRLSRDFVTDSGAQAVLSLVLGYEMSPAEPVLAPCAAVWLLRLLVLVGFFLPCSLPPWTRGCQKGWMGAQELLNALVRNWWELCVDFSEEVLWLFPGPARDEVTLREEDEGHPLPEPHVSIWVWHKGDRS